MPFEGRVLALDLASTTGFAFGAPGSIPKCGHIRFTKLGASRAETYREFRRWLTTWEKDALRPDVICYESPAVPSIMMGRTNISTTRLLFGLAEHLEEWCYNKFELREARVADVRTHFIGSNMKSAVAKKRVFDKCRMLGWQVETTDESDAAALWFYQTSWLNPRLAALVERKPTTAR